MKGEFEAETIAPATPIAVEPLQRAEEVNKAAEPAATASPPDHAVMLERLSALVLGIGGGDSAVPSSVLLNIKPDLHEPLAAALAEGVTQLAQIKNVRLQPASTAALAYWAMEYLDLSTLSALMQADPQAALRVASFLNSALDILAGSQFLCALWHLEGFEDIDPRSLMPLAVAWMRERAVNDVQDCRLRWPDRFDALIAYYRSRSRAGVSVQYPTGVPVRVTLFLDREVFGRLRKTPAKAANPLVPLLTRCPGLPGRYLPDGKQTLRLPDSVTVSGWWRSGKLHRDSKEGPALIRSESGREYREYRFEGELHRDHREGPAVIDTNADGQGGHLEEFWQHGKRHRPAEEGPAAYDTDRHGKLLREIYYEDGACHRDPSQGPAWSGLEDGKYIEAYLTRGQHHRPEEEGPAVTMRDPTSGRLINQEYFCDGRRHRLGGPSLIQFGEDGRPTLELWEQGGVLHRDRSQGPAMISRCESQTRVEYYVDGRCHRDLAEGPARIIRTPAGELVEMGYWLNGDRIWRYRSKRLRRAIRRNVRRHAHASRHRAKKDSGLAVSGILAANDKGAAT